MTDSALSMHRLIAFHAFFAAFMDACSSQKRGLLTSNLMRKPSVCSEESIGFYGGKQWFPREKPMVSAVETDGLQRGKRWFLTRSTKVCRGVCNSKTDGFECKTGRKNYISATFCQESASFCQKSVTLPPYLSPRNHLFSSRLNRR